MAGDYTVALSGGYFQAVDDHMYGESEVGSEFGLLVKRAFLDGKVITALMANVATFGDGYAGADADYEDAHRVAFSIITPF
ncbi:MAG: hypothetical protein C0609_05915 [Deltaproteobacteria bacterium]|nr:MAG: hypothetical protein C0609_05915 [Deltaproteobacteria bacterium]